MLSQRTGKCQYTTLVTSFINSPISPPSLMIYHTCGWANNYEAWFLVLSIPTQIMPVAAPLASRGSKFEKKKKTYIYKYSSFKPSGESFPKKQKVLQSPESPTITFSYSLAYSISIYWPLSYPFRSLAKNIFMLYGWKYV